MDAIETLIRDSAIAEEEMMQTLHLFSVIDSTTREKLIALCKDHPEFLVIFWENYKMKREAYTKKDTALWTSILETEREQIETATE